MKDEMKRASEDIRLLEIRRQAIEGIRVRIRLLESDAAGIGGFNLDRPLTDRRQRKRNGRLGTIEEREKLHQQERVLREWIEHVEQILSKMHPDDVLILESTYGGKGSRGEIVRKLERELHVSQTEIYRMRERALQDFAERMGYIV